MADIRTRWDGENLTGDWLVSGGQLGADADLATAVLISLFTDRLAADDDVIPAGDGDRRGWWATAGMEEVHGVAQIGSRWWLLDRSKQTEAVRQDAEAYGAEALQWLIDQRVATAVTVSAAWAGIGALQVEIVITRNDGTKFERRYDLPWLQTVVS